MSETNITPSIAYIGAEDRTLDLFEGQYPIPNGVTYNSYVILDSKIAVIDTVDGRAAAQWLENLERVLGGREPDYLVISHLEPDHTGGIGLAFEKYPNMKLLASPKAHAMLPLYFELDELEGRAVRVRDGEELCLGGHTLRFLTAPMVHWPEVMVEYETSEKILFSADAFGRFGADFDMPWTDEARRYYINIVGKFGAQVQALLKKATALDIAAICPLHGPVLRAEIADCVAKYDTWSSYRPEERGVALAFCSFHGNTARAARELADMLRARGVTVEAFDLARDDVSAALAAAFRYTHLVLAATTYEGGIHPAMAAFLAKLKSKNFRARTAAFIENGSWAPMSGRIMSEALSELPDIEFADVSVTLRGAVKDADRRALSELADALAR